MARRANLFLHVIQGTLACWRLVSSLAAGRTVASEVRFSATEARPPGGAWGSSEDRDTTPPTSTNQGLFLGTIVWVSCYSSWSACAFFWEFPMVLSMRLAWLYMSRAKPNMFE